MQSHTVVAYMSKASPADTDGLASDEALRPYRQIAVRVLALALRDVANPGGSEADRESARAFLSGSGMLLHWCRVAAVNPNGVVTLAQKLGIRTQLP